MSDDEDVYGSSALRGWVAVKTSLPIVPATSAAYVSGEPMARPMLSAYTMRKVDGELLAFWSPVDFVLAMGEVEGEVAFKALSRVIEEDQARYAGVSVPQYACDESSVYLSGVVWVADADMERGGFWKPGFAKNFSRVVLSESLGGRTVLATALVLARRLATMLGIALPEEPVKRYAGEFDRLEREPLWVMLANAFLAEHHPEVVGEAFKARMQASYYAEYGRDVTEWKPMPRYGPTRQEVAEAAEIAKEALPLSAELADKLRDEISETLAEMEWAAEAAEIAQVTSGIVASVKSMKASMRAAAPAAQKTESRPFVSRSQRGTEVTVKRRKAKKATAVKADKGAA